MLFKCDLLISNVRIDPGFAHSLKLLIITLVGGIQGH
jgi:hypothetical protein